MEDLTLKLMQLKSKKNNNGSTVYLSLEPCAHIMEKLHHANILIKFKKLKKVFYGN